MDFKIITPAAYSMTVLTEAQALTFRYRGRIHTINRNGSSHVRVYLTSKKTWTVTNGKEKMTGMITSEFMFVMVHPKK